ncbi:MAG: abortive infection family protein [Cryobacterium sp.]|nr:abortive infection family protein [Cryobacterium sp.]
MDVDSSAAIKKTRGGLSAVVIGIVELRNAEGSGHGRNRSSPLSPRHARLAVNSARAWCEIALDGTTRNPTSRHIGNRSKPKIFCQRATHSHKDDKRLTRFDPL